MVRCDSFYVLSLSRLLPLSHSAGYDGGDCCECTCEGDSVYSCRAGTFNCIDPEAWCVDDDIITSMSFDFIY